MFNLAAGERIYVDTGAAVATRIVCNYIDTNGSSTFERGARQATPSTATATDASGTPSSGISRAVGSMNVLNVGTSNQTVTVRRHDGTNSAELIKDVTIGPNESLQYTDETGFTVLDKAGRVKTATPEWVKNDGWSTDFNKLGAGATEASGVPYLFYRDTGFPGSFTIGTPGVGGRALTYSGESGQGLLNWTDPASGKRNFLTGFVAAASGTGVLWLCDLLWINTGLVVTTTTAQTVTSAAFPARDLDGTANGRGVQVAVLVTGATTNAGAITNMTMSYTNSNGVSGRTATVSSFPATCTQGSLVFFQLQAGDRGVKSIESVTLGTSLVSGSISIVALRRLAAAGAGTAWVCNPELSPAERGAGVELFNDTCLMPMIRPTSATTYNCDGIITIEER